MILVALTDFTGEYNIADKDGRYTTSKLQSYIDKYEKQYIRRLLGVSLGNDIIAYIPTRVASPNADFDHLIDAFAYQDTNSACNAYLESDGLKDFLLAAILYEYLHVELKNTQAGIVSNDASGARIMSPRRSFRYAEHKYNKALKTVEAIQYFASVNPAKYSGFDSFAGQCFGVKYGDVL